MFFQARVRVRRRRGRAYQVARQVAAGGDRFESRLMQAVAHRTGLIEPMLEEQPGTGLEPLGVAANDGFERRHPAVRGYLRGLRFMA